MYRKKLDFQFTEVLQKKFFKSGKMKSIPSFKNFLKVNYFEDVAKYYCTMKLEKAVFIECCFFNIVLHTKYLNYNNHVTHMKFYNILSK